MSATGILLLAPLLARWALAFGPAEYFALMILAFCCLTSLLGKQPVKGVLAAAIGLFISTVGVDANSGVYRYTFDLVHLSDGIDFVVVVIALFAVTEMLEMLEKAIGGGNVEVKPSGRKLFNLSEMAFTWWSVVRSSLVGFVVGACCRGRAPAWRRPWPTRRKSASSKARTPTPSSAGRHARSGGAEAAATRLGHRLLSCPC